MRCGGLFSVSKKARIFLFSEEKRSKKDFWTRFAVPDYDVSWASRHEPRSASKSLFASFSSEKEESFLPLSF
jgi:hypothetical protein